MQLSIDLEKYIEAHSSPELPILTKIYRETNIRHLNPRMVSGHNQGLFMSFISKMISPQSILEIGTYTGYSAICLTQGLRTGGRLHTIEIDDEIADIAAKYFSEANLDDKITLHVGNACKIVPALKIHFDLIFIDGEKREYPEYYNTCMKFLKPGGYLLADNVLWEGKVLDKNQYDDPATSAINQFNNLINNDSNLENILLPLRDGLMLARKIA
jgi:caffeoyl-CoA O-methyltransferase